MSIALTAGYPDKICNNIGKKTTFWSKESWWQIKMSFYPPQLETKTYFQSFIHSFIHSQLYVVLVYSASISELNNIKTGKNLKL